MPKPGGTPDRVIDRLPKHLKDKVIADLIANVSCRKVAEYICKESGLTLSSVSVAAYKKEIIKPALQNAYKLQKINTEGKSVSQTVAEQAILTKSLVASQPIIAIREKRVAVLDEIHSKMLKVIEERGVNLAGLAPGGDTGLLVRKLKQIGAGESAQVVEEFEVDTGLLSEIRKHQEQAAKELGQWVEHQPSTNVNIMINVPTSGRQLEPGDEGEIIDITQK